MSRYADEEPVCVASEGPLQLVIDPRPHDLGGFTVRRALPAPERQRFGPFIFFDHVGPAQFEPGYGVDVRPHLHVGLATVTYLFEDAFMHRDSLGADADARLMLLGGEPLEGDRILWWNLVSSSRRLIEKVKQDWTNGRFPKVPGDEIEFIPLPGRERAAQDDG